MSSVCPTVAFTCIGTCHGQNIFFRVKDSELSAIEGSCAEIKCDAVAQLRGTNAKWFWIKDSVWESGDYINITYVSSSHPQDVNSDFEGRVKYIGTGPPWYTGQTCSIKICNLRKTDSGRYKFRYAGAAKCSSGDTTLTVTGEYDYLNMKTIPFVNGNTRAHVHTHTRTHAWA